MKSVWQEKMPDTSYPEISGTVKTDILVIGGGMAGILCAWKLQQMGLDVTVVEAERVGGGITARTTAVLTAQHDFLYQDMMGSFGVSAAKAYLDANLEAVQAFRELSKVFRCDFEDRPSIQYTAEDASRLRREARVVKDLGFPAVFQKEIPLPIEVSGAVVYPDMAQFHPLKLLTGIARHLKVYENSRVLQLMGTTAYLEKGSVQAKQVIVATHFPFIDRYGMYFMKLYQSRSYVLALENAPDPGATLAELEGKGIYFRRCGDLLLVGGGDHRTGKSGGGFQYLRSYARVHFPEAREKYAWANQDCMSLDGLPYVGRYSPNLSNVYVATGFNAWGMTNSMVAAQVLADQLCGRKNALSGVLRPNRSVFRKQLLCNIGETLADFVIPTTKRCSHLGCALQWNPREHSWDCPCHGSRFAEDGKLLNTPAQKDIQI